MTDSKPTLATLPDDVLILILGHIDTARDIANLSCTSKNLHHLVQTDGWSIFARSRSPSLSLPPLLHKSNGAQQTSGPDKLSNSLTWQSRAWDRRSIVLRALIPQHQQLRRTHAANFHPTIAAHHDLTAGEELVAWGAGEDIVGRWRRRTPRVGKGPRDGHDVDVKWARLKGSSIDYGPGRDDVTALALVEAPLGGTGTMGILAGRENGHLALLSAKMDSSEDFGRVLTTLRPEEGILEPKTTKSVLTSTNRICSIDVAQGGRTVAVTTQPSLRLYSMPQEVTDEVPPIEVYHLQRGDDADPQSKSGNLHKAKWMPGGEMMALSVTDHIEPIQCLKVTPTGLELTAAAKNRRLKSQYQLNNRICPNSIEPISPSSTVGGNGNLLLSAWRDGTVRLLDIRTPSPFDAVYQDNVDPWSRFESLLPMGTERFVAGGLDGSVVKIFDFRLPRTYHYSSALPCSPNAPMPPPSQPFMSAPSLADRTATCNHVPPRVGHCVFHRLASDLFSRPNCSLFFHTRDQPTGTTPAAPRRGRFSGDPRRKFPNDPGVWSLARGADASPHFYIGVAGGILEASLQNLDGSGDPHFGMKPLDFGNGVIGGAGSSGQQSGVGRGSGQPVDTASDAQYADLSMGYSIMETGDGLRYNENERAIRLPPMIRRRDGVDCASERFGGTEGKALRNVWRLDEAFDV